MDVLKQIFDFGADVQVLEVVCVVRTVDLDATGFMTLVLGLVFRCFVACARTP